METPRRRFQFKLSTAIAVMLTAGAALGLCARRWYYNRPEVVLRCVETADPIRNAQHAIQDGDLRLLGIYGVGLSVPAAKRAIFDHYSVRGIPGTSDCINSGEHARLQELAWHYAEKYNQIILDAIERQPQ